MRPKLKPDRRRVPKDPRDVEEVSKKVLLRLCDEGRMTKKELLELYDDEVQDLEYASRDDSFDDLSPSVVRD